MIKINSQVIGDEAPPYVIAEISANHNGSIENAFKLIKAARDAGASAVKLQTYKPDTITMNSNADEFMIKDGLWAGRSLYDLYKEAHTPWDWHKPLFEYANEVGITIFSSPFDFTAVDLLEALDAPAYKIASFEILDLPLIEYIAKTGKPIIMSTGMATLSEITEGIEAARQSGCVELALLHCVSGYPAPANDYNLKTIPDMKIRFSIDVGLSDHTLSNTTAIAAVALGASIIEKHFTLNRLGGGPDDSFSLEPSGLADLCLNAKIAWESIGKEDYCIKSSEEGNLQYRRSLYFAKDLEKGAVISADCIRSIRPGFGLLPKFYKIVIGRKVARDVSFATPVQWEDLE